jgi:large subunit ribosomal protein L25
MRRDIKLTAETRETRGKNEARRLRARGLTPAIAYGAGGDPVALAISPKEVQAILRSTSGQNTIFNVDLNGQSSPVMIVDWQHDPIKGKLLHVDLKRIDPNKRMTAKVPVHTTGVPVGVKIQGGLYEIINREIEIECLPDDIPQDFTVDVTNLSIGQSLRASEVPLTGSMRLLTPGESVVSHVVALRAVAPDVVEPTAAVAEPEVVKKGKKEEEAAAPAKKEEKKKK